MIEVQVSRLGIDPGTQAYVVVLQEKGGARLLPIWIGQPEAESIVMHMHNMKRARPLTHDLCKSLITGLGATLKRVQITRVENNTYYGELHLDREGNVVHVDSRPSDATAPARSTRRERRRAVRIRSSTRLRAIRRRCTSCRRRTAASPTSRRRCARRSCAATMRSSRCSTPPPVRSPFTSRAVTSL